MLKDYMFNPDQRAGILRKNLIKGDKYLLAKIAGAGQDPGEKKVFADCFRYKDYIDDPKWMKASEKEKWSERFLGLNEKKEKNLEFQNPTYSAACRLKRLLKEFTKVFTFQVASCNYMCNYCYVPRELNSGSKKYGRFFSAEEIVDEFLKIREKSEMPMNTIRISGGEPLIIPEIVIDVYNEMVKKSPDSYLWIDTNLSTLEIVKKYKTNLKKVFESKNVGIVGCFKGIAEEDFSLITGAERRFYQEQFETAKLLIDLEADFYAYLPAYVYDEKMTEEKLEKFLKRLQGVNKNLPLRLEMLKVEDFPAAKINFELAKKEGRGVPKTPQEIVFDLWYNKLLPKHYLSEELKKFCCEVKL